ncbi:hypothetical protein E8E12_011574 [Didymella heteroderae]|uniref:Hemerythrin-like domain-containing protein n=1 Tax=Didymella heteroderae TaxID=1769908 RepID=A0A9P4X192_9PLEO|nr:hypothetical protein E8E12_011574 [Didymella heteroderae]
MTPTKFPPQSRPWADHPCALVSTSSFTANKTDIWTTGATHMAHIHNAILRGYNTVYLQAPHVRDVDKASFVGYALTWYKFVKTHHDDEEGELFRAVAAVLGTSEEAVWGATHREHEAFLSGLGDYAAYLSGLPTPSHLDGNKLCMIMQAFKEPFEAHFHAEIGTIASLAEMPNAPAPGSEKEKEAAAIFKVWGKKTVMKAGITDVVPFFLMNLDATYEEGRWANWPPIPAPVRWGLINVAGSWNWSWWKFASCDSSGRPRELYALGEKAE